MHRVGPSHCPILCLALGVLTGCAAEPTTPERRCVAPDGMGAPRTISAAVDLLNALPAPVDVACFVEALDRPLTVQATSGLLSAQPAAGPRDPRVFIYVEPLVLSVVPAGAGQPLLEFGEQVEPGWSLKGELHLPHAGPLADTAPFDDVRYNAEVTTCGVCHRAERRAPDVDHANAYVSRSLRGLPSERVDLAVLSEERAACDAEADPTRCAILAAVVDHGPLVEWRVPADWDTLYDP